MSHTCNLPTTSFINVHKLIDCQAIEELVAQICILADDAEEIVEDLPYMHAGVQTEIHIDRKNVRLPSPSLIQDPCPSRPIVPV